MSEPNAPQTPPADPELIRQRQEIQLRGWERNNLSEIEMREAQQRFELERRAAELRIADETGLTARVLLARHLATSNLVPAGFRAGKNSWDVPTERDIERAAASILLAQEFGRHLGFEGIQSLQHLQVIEGNIKVKPSSARGMMRSRGIQVEDVYTDDPVTGFTVKCVTRARRPKPAEVLKTLPEDASENDYYQAWDESEYTLEMALRGGMISEVRTDPQGNIVGVTARDSNNKPKPWERFTRNMLTWRATSFLVDRFYSDITGGMGTAEEGMDDIAAPVVRADQPPTEVQRVTAARGDRAGVYDPAEDLARFSDDDPWWNHADANVSRRSKKQLAADRLRDAAAAGDSRVPARPRLPETMTRPVDFDDPEETEPLTQVPMRPADESPDAAFDAELRAPAVDGPPADNLFTDDELLPEPPEDWTPTPRTAAETRQDLLDRLNAALEGRDREKALARFYVLRAPRREDEWTDDEIRVVLEQLEPQ